MTSTARRTPSSARYVILGRRLRGPLALAAICAAPVALWAVAQPLSSRWTDPSTTLISIAIPLALAGTCAFALNLVLGARLRVVEWFFGGLDRMYGVHKINGRVAFCLLLGHALLITAGRAVISVESAGALYSGGAGWVVSFGVLALVFMTVAIVFTLYGRLNHEWFIYVQRSFGFIFMLASLHVFMTAGAKASSPALTLYLAAVSLAGLAAFAYRSLLGDVFIPRLQYSVLQVTELGDHSVREITMATEGRRLSFTPGQFVFVTFGSNAMSKEFHALTHQPAGESEVMTFRAGAVANQWHPFSITSSPSEPELRIAVKEVGDFTSALHWLENGAEARVEGPYGAFSHLRIPNKRQIWLAGGIGITPFLSMARGLDSPGYQIDLYYGMEHDDEGYFLQELAGIGDRYPGLRVIPWQRNERGFITAEAVARISGPLEEPDYLICGPPAMIDNLTGQLRAAGVPDSRIHFEKFGFV
ncbi:MAG: ferric reductase-like transmembrane domain-containing protein [Actinomycetota bacterium]|nr:ferric reductase-like transmembrane domain-containing protein [Actinomycetota bacterium]